MAYPTIPTNRIKCSVSNQIMIADIIAAINANNTAISKVITESKSVHNSLYSSINNLRTEMAELHEIVDKMNIPTGTVVAYSGNIASIPVGWRICDGGGGTPNLINKFIFGTKIQSEVRTTGGSANAETIWHTHTQQPHVHTGSTASAGIHRHNIKTFKQHTSSGSTDYAVTGSSAPSSYPFTDDAGNHSHNISLNAASGNIDNIGVDGTDKNLPPYMKLAYIIKL